MRQFIGIAGIATVRTTLLLLGTIVASQALGDDFRISFVPEPGGASSPGVAWNGSRFLVVWWDKTVKGFAHDIHGQFVSGDGALIDSTFPVMADTSRPAAWPAVASDGENFLSVWFQMEYFANVYGQMVSGTGALIGTIVDICVAPDTQDFPAVACAGSTYLVVWTDMRNNHQPDIYGQLVSRNGALIDTNFPIATASYTEYSGVAGGDSTFLAVWRQGGNIYGQVVALNGALVNSAIPICTAVNTQDHPHAAFDGTKYLVVWGDTRSGSWQTYGQFVSPTGTLIDTNFFVLTYSGFRNSVSWDGTNYLAAVGEGEGTIQGQFIASDGTLVGSDFKVSVLDSTDFKSRPAAAWGTTSHLVVWQDHRGRVSGDDIWGNMVPRVSIEESPAVQVARCRLQVCPNPFTHNAVVEFGVRGWEFVDEKPSALKISDLSGRIVEETSGNVIGERLEPGIYFLKARGYEPEKIVKLK